MQTLVLVDYDLNVTFVERTRKMSGEEMDSTEERFQLKFKQD